MGGRNRKRWIGWMLAGLMTISTPVFADGAIMIPPASAEAVVDHPEAMTVSDLPAPYAETIVALQANLASQFEVIARAGFHLCRLVQQLAVKRAHINPALFER